MKIENQKVTFEYLSGTSALTAGEEVPVVAKMDGKPDCFAAENAPSEPEHVPNLHAIEGVGKSAMRKLNKLFA